MAFRGTTFRQSLSSVLALQAIRAVGPHANKDFVIRQLFRALSARDRAQFAKLIKHAPAWSHEIIRQLKGT